MTLTEKREAKTLAIVSQQSQAAMLEQVLIKGDLKALSDEQRMQYYQRVCESAGLNPLTQPFAYIVLNGKLTLYALRSATDQLRAVHGVSVIDMDKETSDGVHIVTVKVQDAKGRTDMGTGAVSIANLKGEALANALMKAETKAKRRATLSICGLGLLDETEVETIPGAVSHSSPAPDAAGGFTPARQPPTVNPETGHAVDPSSARQQKLNGTWEACQEKIRSFTDINALDAWWDHPATKAAIAKLAPGIRDGAEIVYQEQQELLAEKLKRELDEARSK